MLKEETVEPNRRSSFERDRLKYNYSICSITNTMIQIIRIQMSVQYLLISGINENFRSCV